MTPKLKDLEKIMNQTILGGIAIGIIGVVLLIVSIIILTLIEEGAVLISTALILISWITGKKIFDHVEKRKKERGF